MKWNGVNYVRHTSGCVEGDSLRNMAKVLSLYMFLFGVVYNEAFVLSHDRACDIQFQALPCSSGPFHKSRHF